MTCVSTEASVIQGVLASQMWDVHSSVALVVECCCDTSASLVGYLYVYSVDAVPALPCGKCNTCWFRNCLMLLF
jgi:hypothetical protein